MRILVAVDQNPYSTHAVSQVAGLAVNTWADITLLGLQPKTRSAAGKAPAGAVRPMVDPSLYQAMHTYRDAILGHFETETSPYAQVAYDYQLLPIETDRWQELLVGRSTRKDFNVVIRQGNPAREILAEAERDGSDLIVLGCQRGEDCAWEEWGNVPQKIAAQSACTVWIIKKERGIKKILCCLDHDLVSQESLEMISQMVTLYQAELDIVGLTEGRGLRENVERKLDRILKYYQSRDIFPLIELVALSSLEEFISREASWGLMTLWMGKKSLLEKVLPKNKVTRLIRSSDSSVLLLK